MIDIKARVNFYKEIKNMNNNQLAKASGLNPSVISSLFTRASKPELCTLEAMCKGFEITLSEFFAVDGLHDLTENQTQVLDLYDRLPSEKKKLTIDVMKAFLTT